MSKDSLSFKNIFKSQTKLATYIIICTTIVVLSASYALFFQVDSNSNNQVVEAGDLTFIYSNNSVISNTNCFEPMNLDEANLYANNCSYQLSIRNTGSLIADYNLFLVPKEDNTADLSNLKIIIRQNGSMVSGYPKGVVSGAGDSTHVGTTDAFLTGSINPGDTILYSAQIYVDDTTSFAPSENKKVSFDIRGALAASDTNPVSGQRPPANEITLAKLQELNPDIVLNDSMNNQTGSCPTMDPTTKELQINGPEDSASLLCEAEDDYGVTYYYRGNVENNYVKFGKWQTDNYYGYANYSTNGIYTSLTDCETAVGSGNCTQIASSGDDMYWRIVRINGDGSLRMIYDGTSAFANINSGGSTSNAMYRMIGKATFKIGYMFNDAYTSYAAAWNVMNNKNAASSAVKTKIDSWYENNLLANIPNSAKKYSDYISLDSIFCEDKNVQAGPGYPDYLMSDYVHYDVYNVSRFTCVNTEGTVDPKNDQFTVSSKGNGALTYPVAILTIDEAIAGGLWDTSASPYLRTGSGTWAMTPLRYDEVDYGSYISQFDDTVAQANWSSVLGIRPVISLKANVTFASGTDGTINNPFEIVYN